MTRALEFLELILHPDRVPSRTVVLKEERPVILYSDAEGTTYWLVRLGPARALQTLVRCGHLPTMARTAHNHVYPSVYRLRRAHHCPSRDSWRPGSIVIV
jgi:hypothetical protein